MSADRDFDDWAKRTETRLEERYPSLEAKIRYLDHYAGVNFTFYGERADLVQAGVVEEPVLAARLKKRASKRPLHSEHGDWMHVGLCPSGEVAVSVMVTPFGCEPQGVPELELMEKAGRIADRAIARAARQSRT
jgi:hypothetical protein